MKKTDMSDVTIVMPLRIDSPIRLDNIRLILDYLINHMEAEFIVLEADMNQKGAVLDKMDHVSYIFREDIRSIFYSTHYRNEMIKMVTTPIVAVWDVDVFAPLNQIEEAINKIRDKEAVIAYPYNGLCHDVPQEISQTIRTEGNLDMLTLHREEYPAMFGGLSNGGLFFADRGKYMEIGMENEHFYGWGPEDAERLKRATILGIPMDNSGRIEYLQQLMNYTAIDSYGRILNNRQLSADNGNNTRLETFSKYKFVIAFENAIGVDYVTEKYFDALIAGTVPIYLGAPNIQDFAPGINCFVDVRQFDGPSSLAGFINSCYEDDRLYSGFFEWKTQPLTGSFLNKAEEQRTNPIIRLCRKVEERLMTLHEG